ncbi:MAG: hypothetical protein ACRDQ2_14515, partial [Gaiellales bacterium]
GVLWDLSGNDSYSALKQGLGGLSAQAAATGCGAVAALPPSDPPHGGGGNCSWGGLIDTGGGDDVYTASASLGVVPTRAAIIPEQTVIAQGGAIFSGAALLHDDGGVDRFEIVASVANPDEDSYPLGQFSGGAPYPWLTVLGQGMGSVGAAGLLLSGTGRTTYTLTGTARGIARLKVAGQGAGELGAGVLEDLGGDDTYTIGSHLSHERDIVVSNVCECDRAEAEVSGSSIANARLLQGQGAGALGPGLLRDRAGNDVYVASGRADMDVVLRDELTASSGPPELHVLGYRGNVLWAQGTGNAASALIDEAGSDSYSIDESGRTSARVVSGQGMAPVVTAVSHAPIAQGQGSGSGALLDAGGAHDLFTATSDNAADTAPDSKGSFQYARQFDPPGFQGAGHYAGDLFVAAGDDPKVSSSPSLPTCRGHRGYGEWWGCTADTGGNTSNLESVPSGRAPAATGSEPSLSFTENTPGQASLDHNQNFTPGAIRMPVQAKLLDPGGNPIPGQTIHFFLERRCPGCSAGSVGFWDPLWRTQAVTQTNGIATADLPLLGTGKFPAYSYRVSAIFDGRPGRPGVFPAYITKGITLVS